MIYTRWLKFDKGRQKNFNKVKYIKDEIDRLLMKNDENKNRLREYLDKLFNEENEKITIELDNSFDDTNRQFI
jgi:hypothetical protein